MGSKGTFDVMVDETLTFLKAEEKRFPEEGEILTLFEDVLGHKVEKYPRDKVRELP
jgi:selenoprotein W-related protein